MKHAILALALCVSGSAWAQDDAGAAASSDKFEVERMPDGLELQPTNCQNHNPSQPSCFAFEPLPLPKSVEEFQALRDDLMSRKNELTRIYGGAVLFLHAMLVRNENRELGDQLLVMALDRSNLKQWTPKPWSGSEYPYKGYTWDRSTSFPVNNMDAKPYMIRSYAQGTLPVGQYQLDTTQPVSWSFRKQNKYNGDPATSSEYKVFVCTGGQLTCRPVNMRKNNRGIWKVEEFNTLGVDINVGAPPEVEQFDDDL